MKKTKINTKILLLLIVVALIPSGFVFTSMEFYKEGATVERTTEDIKADIKIPQMSTLGIPFDHADKDLQLGIQENAWNEDNIRSYDGTQDVTQFVPGSTYWIFEDTVSPATVPIYTGAFGSTDGPTNGGDWWFTDAYKDNDDIYFYLESTWGNNYPGTIQMKWGEYNDFSNTYAIHVHTIRIQFEVWADSALGVLDQSTNLRFQIYADNGAVWNVQVAATPGHRVPYTQTHNIQSGPVFDRVKAGGFVKHAGVSMYCNEEWLTTTWINIDFLDIYYRYYKYNVQFDYSLDYGSLGLGVITKFDLYIKMDETKAGTKFLIWNDAYQQWVQQGTAEVGTTIKKEIYINASDYFTGAKVIKVRFELYNFLPSSAYTNHELRVNMVKLELFPPETPANLVANNEVLHVALNWDAAITNGPPLINYSIYRGLLEGGPKTLLAKTSNTYYDDYAASVGTRYYYTVSVTTFAGSSGNSTEASGRAYDSPFIEWISPNENEHVVLPKGEFFTNFTFEYEYIELDDAELVLDYGPFNRTYNVWNKTSVSIDVLSDYKDGSVTATLKGINQTVVVDTDVRHFTFVRIIIEVLDNIDSNTEILGKQLYMILHDPHGDNSYSSFSQTSTVSMGVGCQITSSTGMSLEIGDYYDLFGIQVGGSLLLEYKTTAEMGFDFRFELSDTTTLTSSQVVDNPDYIGPGYGDRYWGESWIFKWVLNATYRVYSNGTDRWEDPQLFYGILRDVETFASDADAPAEWKAQNAVHNDTLPVDWIDWFMESGGAPYTFDRQVSTTATRTTAFSLDFSADVGVKIPGLATHVSMEMSMRNYAEFSVGNIYEVSYEIYDDDPDDFIVQGIGIDKIFGTYIFNSSAFFCETSLPYEHNTWDYIAPIIDWPEIELDSDGDLLGPTTEDSPIVTVEIFEEGGVQEAVIWYSINNGTDWEIAILHELPGNLGTWRGSIPAQEFNTTVLWYIQAWDDQGNNSTRYSDYLNPFEYTVIEKPPISPSAVPSFSVVTLIPITIVAVIAITIIHYRKRLIYKK
jgi:hypothetical protein